jgi:YVTN family beta-propeller protein
MFRRVKPVLLGSATAFLCLLGALAVPSASQAAAALRPAVLARPGANLLLNPGAQAGAYSAQGWDAVTIPGWRVTGGLPTVVRYGTTRFPRVTGHGPAVRGGQLFAGGAGGTARLEQVIRLRAGGTRTRYRLAGYLGGSKHNAAAVTAAFLSASGQTLGHATIGPFGGTTAKVTQAHRAAAGTLPAGTATVRVTLVLSTTHKNYDGPNAPLTGYNYSAADGLDFQVSTQAPRPVLTRPVAGIPRYQHVFLFYFENEDLNAVIGNKRQAPFLNSLLPHASLLSNFYAEEHPSDANYLALAGGSAFGVPLTDPLEENSQYTIRARNIGDLIGAAHESWKTYLQSAAGPCDDTVHGNYWDDDEPMTYFADVRERPAYCAAHLLPLEALPGDLASARATPNFAWVSPDDCADMEGCGIKAGDNFLAVQLGAIMRSPAWRTQRSLAIITFDEDGYDFEHPSQRVATLLIGSAGVRQGYVSHRRYTHYSLLRTIEGALGLGTLTANDSYAAAVTDAFLPGTAGAARMTWLPARRSVSPAAPAAAAAAAARVARPLAAGAPAQPTAFVANSASNSVTPVNLVTHKAGKAIAVGRDPQAVAVTPDGATAYVVNSGSNSVTPIGTVSRRAGPAIPVGADPQAIAITPDGRTAYVTDAGSDSVTPIDLATGRAQPAIPVGSQPHSIAITPDGRTVLVLNWGGATVTPIRLGGSGGFGRAGRPIPVGGYPSAVAIAPDGQTAYVANYGSDTVTPIALRGGRDRAGSPLAAGHAPNAVAVTPDSAKVFAVGGDSDTVTPISAASLVAGPVIRVGYSPTAVAVSPSGRTAYVVNTINGTVTPIAVATGKKGRAISVGLYAYPTQIDMLPSGLAIVVSPYGGQISLINTGSNRVVANVSVGSYPDAVAVAG